MATYFDVFNIKSDMQLNNIMNNLELTPNEMFALDDIINEYSSINEKRNKILEMFSGTNNYNYCKNVFLKEDMEVPSQLNMNQTIELNELFALASEKFKKVNCSQQFYQMLSQKTSKNFANAFFNMLKSIPEDSNCRFDPNLTVDGKNFAETIYPFVNELKTFLNGCKSQSKKEVNENYAVGNKVQGKNNQGTYIIDSIKDGFYNLRNVYDQNRNKLYPVSKKTLDEEFKLLNESIEKEISFDKIKDFAEKYNLIPMNKNEKANGKTYAKFITYPKKTNFDEFKKNILNHFGNNIEVVKGRRLKDRFVVGIWYNGIDNLNESIETQPDMFGGPDTYYKDGIEALDFDNVLDAMNKVAPEMDFVDDRDVKGKYSMIFQPKSSGLELNQKGLKKIKDYLSQKFGKENISVRLAHSQYAPEIKKLYVTFINQIDVQNELNESLEDTLKNFRYFISTSSNNDELNMMKDKLEILFNDSNDTQLRNTITELLSMINSKLNTIKPIVDECCDLESLLEPFKTTVVNITVNDEGCLKDAEKEIATNNLKALASHINDKKDCCEENNMENVQTIMSLINSLASFFQRRLCESQVIEKNPYKGDTLADQTKANMWRPSEEELDEDTVYDHSWYEVKGQKYPKRTKNGVEIKEGIKDWFKKDNRKYRIEYGTHGGWISKDKKHIVGDLTDTLIVTGLKKAERLAKYFDNGDEPRMFHPDEIKQTDKGWNFQYTQEFLDILEKVKNGEMSEEEAKNYFEKIGLPVSEYWNYLKLALPNKKKVDEMCSGGACCAGAVATVPSPVKPKSPKRKHKKSKVDEMALNMFKRHIIEDINSQIDANGNHYEYKDGYFYINGDIARTKSKYQMLESLDEMIELETLPGFNSEEMKLFEDIEASGNIGNEDDNNQDNNNDSNNNANNNNNQQNTNQNFNQNNLGNVEQNVTQDNDLTPQQRQLKKDNEKVLDQSLNSGNDTNVSVNQGMDDNNDTTNNPTPNTDNIKYKVIGKDDSDSNNIKYIIQDPNSKQTMVVDATKLRLEK